MAPPSDAAVRKAGTPLAGQSFHPVAFERFGEASFTTTVEKAEDQNRYHFYVETPDKGVELQYEPFFLYNELKAVSFRDLDGDGLKDILILVDYITGAGNMGTVPATQALIYRQTGSDFTEDAALEDRLADVNPYRLLTVPLVTELLKARSAEESYAAAWAKVSPGTYRREETDDARLVIEKADGGSLTFSVTYDGAPDGGLRSVEARRSYAEMVFNRSDVELSVSLLEPGLLYLYELGEMGYHVRGTYHLK